VVDRTFRFHQAENEFLKRCICVAPSSFSSSRGWRRVGGGSVAYPLLEETGEGGGGKFIHCSDGNVVVEWTRPSHPAAAQEVYLKYRTNPFPSVGHFYLLLYDDHLHSALSEVWLVTVHSLLRMDVHGVMGQGSPCDLVVRGDRFSRQVPCRGS
jgi:hypothetical protein